MAEKKEQKVSLRTADDLTGAHEYLFNKQLNGQIDSKQADGMNTTLKGAVYLRVKLRMDLLKIIVQAAKSKVKIPENLLPDGMTIADLRSSVEA